MFPGSAEINTSIFYQCFKHFHVICKVKDNFGLYYWLWLDNWCFFNNRLYFFGLCVGWNLNNCYLLTVFLRILWGFTR
uniref:Uncharacterized protein n=1 Tax=uncultured marine virus TaxID=186617 RepID=A0A0F7L4P8_9VIRU|nr:hypothetical protein [uncultured marine virus]